LLVSTSNLDALSQYPEARQLKSNLLADAASDRFDPPANLRAEDAAALLKHQE